LVEFTFAVTGLELSLENIPEVFSSDLDLQEMAVNRKNAIKKGKSGRSGLSFLSLTCIGEAIKK
jgi:hypothetical protein